MMKNNLPDSLNIAISIKDLTFSYDDINKKDNNNELSKPVIKDLSLDIKKGSFLCITGESGCGKSTLLRLINLLLVPQKGQIKIFNEIISPKNMIALRRNMGYILQGNSLFPHYTAYQNMTYCMNLDKPDDEKNRKRIEELLPVMNLSADILDKYPKELSGGQKQRVGIIRGIAHRPQIILMDEPFSALDPETRENLQDLVKRIHRETHTTFVMVTHSISEAEKLGSDILKMETTE